MVFLDENQSQGTFYFLVFLFGIRKTYLAGRHGTGKACPLSFCYLISPKIFFIITRYKPESSQGTFYCLVTCLALGKHF